MDTKTNYIADRARDIFMKYGIRSVSMDDICRELGMSKKTLYQYFGNKSDLVRQTLEQSLKDFEGKIAIIGKQNYTAVDDLLELSKVIDQHMKDVNQTVTFDLKKYYPGIHREFLEKKRDFAYDYVRKNIEKGINQGFYRPDLNIELIAKLYIQKIEDLHDPNFYEKDTIPFGEIFQVMFENHIRGIANKNGIKYFEERIKTLKFDW